MKLGVITKDWLERRESRSVPWVECSIIKRLRRVKITERSLKRKKTKRAQCPGSQVKKVHQGRGSEDWELIIENRPLYRSLVILIRQFRWSGGGQSLIRVGCKNPLTAFWDSDLSLLNFIFLTTALIIFLKLQTRSCDSLADFSGAPKFLKN